MMVLYKYAAIFEFNYSTIYLDLDRSFIRNELEERDKFLYAEDSKTLFLMNYCYLDKKRRKDCSWLVKKTFLEEYELQK